MQRAKTCLEVGCGTGVIADELRQWGGAAVFGIDLRRDFLSYALRTSPALSLSQADAFQLPFAAASFDCVFCHYFLLWLAHPEKVLQELRRVLRPGGVVLALAEPDYGGRIDFPTALAAVGRLQAQALRRQGADPEIGRRLASLFHAAGLVSVRSGVLGGQWGQPSAPGEPDDREIQILAADLAGQISPDELNEYARQDAAAWQSGERILYIPTFYAWGFNPGSSHSTAAGSGSVSLR